MKQNPVIHFEMPYENAKRVCRFYADVFGWQMQTLGEEMGNYILAQTAETENMRPKTPGVINGGFFPKSEDNKHPLVIIGVKDIKEAIKKIKEADGQVLGEPMEIPEVGLYVSFIDSEKNKVSLLEPLKDGS